MGSLMHARPSVAGLCDHGAIRQLEDHLRACIDSRDYGAARHIEAQLQQLKHQQERNALEALAAQQAEERAANEAVFTQARQELTFRWQERMAQMQDQLMINQQQLMARHEEETADLLAAQMSTPARPRFTPLLLNMRRIERNLAEQKNFTKANKVKQQADQQELLELQCFDADKLSKWELERAGLAAQHAREQAAADKKVSSALLEAQLLQQQELEQLTRRFQAAQLAMSRTHAAQQLKAATALRGTLGLPKPPGLMSLPSFNTSLMPPRPLIEPPPMNPAESCRPAHLFEETLQPAPCHAGLQPASGLIPTLLAHTPGLNQAQLGSLSYGSFKAGPMSCSSSSSIGRGASPGRRSQALGSCSATPRSRAAAADCIQAWGGGSILSSGMANQLARGAPNMQNPMLAQPGSLSSRGCSPARGVQTAGPGALGNRGLSPGKGMQSLPMGGSSRGCSPGKGMQPPFQSASNSSFRDGSRDGSPARIIRSNGQSGSPSAPPSAPASPFCPPGNPSMGSGRAPSPARMPHPPCQPSGNSSRPCSPAVRMRTRSPQRTVIPGSAGNGPLGSPPGMNPSNARFFSPSRSRHGGAAAGNSAQHQVDLPPRSQSPYEQAYKGAHAHAHGHEHAARGNQQDVMPAQHGSTGSRQQPAQGARTAARLSDGMGAGTASLQLGPPMQAPVVPPIALNAAQQQWLGHNMQRLESMIGQLNDFDDGLVPLPGAGPVPVFAAPEAAVHADAGADEHAAVRSSRGSSHNTQAALHLTPRPVEAPAEASALAEDAADHAVDADAAGQGQQQQDVLSHAGHDALAAGEQQQEQQERHAVGAVEGEDVGAGAVGEGAEQQVQEGIKGAGTGSADGAE